MKQRETLTNEQARQRIAMHCSCHEHVRKPQPEDDFNKVVPGLSPSYRILRTVAAVVLTFWTSPVDYFLLGARSLCMRKARDLGLQACHNKLPVDVIVFVSLEISCVRVNFPEFLRYFYWLIF